MNMNKRYAQKLDNEKDLEVEFGEDEESVSRSNSDYADHKDPMNQQNLPYSERGNTAPVLNTEP
jgi:hypothetical protein